MAKHTVQAAARYQLRGDTMERLQAENPVLHRKEPLLVLNDAGAVTALVFGDGVTPFVALPRFAVPQKGINYFTDADKDELVEAVLAALPNGDEVAY